MKRTKLVVLLLAMMIAFAGCNNTNNTSIDNLNNVQSEPEVTEETKVSDFTEEDWKTVEYINANSNLDGIEFMEKLELDVFRSYNPETGEGYMELSENASVFGTGKYVKELDAKYITYVSVDNYEDELDSNILGVKNGDTVGEAINKLAEHGFTDYEDNPPYHMVSFKKGRIVIVLLYSKQNSKQSFEDYEVSQVDAVLNY